MALFVFGSFDLPLLPAKSTEVQLFSAYVILPLLAATARLPGPRFLGFITAALLM